MCMKIRQIVPESWWPATCNHRGVAALTFLCQQARAACQKGIVQRQCGIISGKEETANKGARGKGTMNKEE